MTTVDMWASTLEVAKHLASLKDDQLPPEIVRRAAISRAYYAAFLVARQVSWERDPNHKDQGRSHGAIIRWWQTKDPGVARMLRGMREKRVLADYHAYDVAADTMTRVITLSERAIRLLKEAYASMQ